MNSDFTNHYTEICFLMHYTLSIKYK